MSLIIDPEFRDLIPPLSQEERDGLEANLLAHGCHTPITTWNSIIIDGHNRYILCGLHGIPFDTRALDFASRTEAIIWIIRNQFDRRNLSVTDRMDLALRMKSEIQAQAQLRRRETEGRPKAGHEKLTENLPEVSRSDRETRTQVAALAGVSGRTLDKYEAVKNTAAPELLQATREGKVSIHAAAQAAKTLTKEEQIDALSKAPGKLGEVVRKEIARKKEIDEANAWVLETNAKYQPPGFDPAAERQRMQITHTLYGALEEITKLPEPEEFLSMVREWSEYRLQNLEPALAWLVKFQELYKEKNNETVATVA